MPLPKGQYLVKDFIDITIENNDKKFDNLVVIVKDKQKIFDYSELIALMDTKLSLDMHCVDGWSVQNNTFEGVSLKKISEIVNVKDFEYIGLESIGGYKSFVDKDYALDSFVCLRLNGSALSKSRGFPMRFIAPKLYAYKWVKHLYKITFTNKKPYGYWEDRGYSARARVEFQERFKED
ncbi:MAG: molybdopterin-dependent oxidoreductase [Desulfurella sp.]|uniref:molybdopterin-dependent oxidoreductase n=1 Tax=Desulfurella sp. TaxID=1962857 RepID=UPI003C9A09A3